MNNSKQILKLFWQHAWQYPKYVIGLLIMLPVATVTLRLVPPIIAANILKRLSERDFDENDVWGSFGSDIVLYSVILIFGGIFAWRIVIYLIWKLQSYVERDIHRRMFKKFMDLGADFHANNFGGSLVSQTNKLVGSYVRLQDTFAFQFYLLIFSFVFISVILYPKAPLFVWAMLAFSAIFTAGGVILSKRVRELARDQANAQNKQTGYSADSITNILAIKSFSSSRYEQERFARATEGTRRKDLKVMWATTKRDFMSSTITTIVGIIALVVAVAAVVVYDADIALVFLLLTYAQDITERLWELNSTALRNYNRSIGDAQEGYATLHTSISVRDPQNPEPLQMDRGHIEFKEMTFDHEENKNDDSLFKNLNLSIKPGEKIGLVGHSGGGKTTITKLLLRFMDIDSGEILIDGQNISHVTQDDLRSVITYVPQEPLLFHRTLAENISYGKSSDHDRVEEVAKLAHAHEFIEKLPKGYETLVGERGVKLSGGQRQRVAIARAMLKDAPILLLDEATSALDSESEKLIQDALWKLMENKTAIVIAHRLSTIQKMDRILVLENGEIVEDGSHTELLKNDGIYAELWKHQSGGFLED